MKDRIPTKPGRIKLTDENGVSKYYTLERADEPTEEGTPINKATLLSDDTAGMFGLSDSEALPDNALRSLLVMAMSGREFDSLAELEDLYIEYDSFDTATSGWVTHEFKNAFDGVPVVLINISLSGNYFVLLNNITESSFQYEVVTTTTTAGSFSASNVACTVNYIALYFGGDEE